MLVKSNAIKLEKVNKVFKVRAQDVWILKYIDLDIFFQEFAVVFGPSGSGKSTMLHIMLGLEPPSTGKVTVLGLDIYNLSEEELSDYRKKFIGMIYQQPNWLKALTVIENVAFPLALQGVNRKEALDYAYKMLELVKMEKWAEYSPSELSSGQQQKVAFARAVVTKPQIIVADEPTGNLDVVGGNELLSLFKEQSKNGTTIVLVTHNPENIDYADKVIQFADGRIIQTYEVNKENVEQVKVEIYKKPLKELKSLDLYSDNFIVNRVKLIESKINPFGERIRGGLSPLRFFKNVMNILKGIASYSVKSVIIVFVLVMYVLQVIIERLWEFRIINATLGSDVKDSINSLIWKLAFRIQRKDAFSQI